MKIILSRKGFDSSIQGGGSANIVYNSECFPIQIPEVNTKIKYEELKFNDTNYLKVMRDLNINQFTECHFDPYLSKKMIPENHPLQHWKKSLGQCGIAQTILEEAKIGEGDLFIFFGWFNSVEKVNGKYKYEPLPERNKEGFHLIYGYLEVGGDPIDINSKKLPKWVKSHPHYIQNQHYPKPNAIYTANQLFTKNKEKPGAGIFKFHENLILTENRKSRTNWILPEFFHPDNGTEIKYLPNHWENLNNGKTRVKASSRGQEFVVLNDPNKKIEQWAIDLINNNEVVS